MDNAKYIAALETFLNEMYRLPDSISPNVSIAISDLCEVLGIGCVKVNFYSGDPASHLKNCNTLIFYENDKYDIINSFDIKYKIMNESTATYKFHPLKDRQPWTDQEKDRIKMISNTLYTFNSRSKVLDLAVKLNFYDPDINAYNLKFFHKFTRAVIERNDIESYAAINFNLKQFTVINQRVGRPNGTKIMEAFILYIQQHLNDDEVVCRIGGDNFAVLVKKENLQSIIDILMGTDITIPEINGEMIHIAAAVGVYRISNSNSVKASTDIMDRMNLVLQIAKKSIKPEVVFFDSELMEMRRKRNAISASFEDAIANREFVVYYQPKVSLDGFRIAGAEALCRWIKDGQIVPPGLFIPVLEQGHDICKLDFYMLDTVCQDLRKWLDEKRDPVRVSVNFSRRHLSDTNLVKLIVNTVDKYNIPHELIEIELTETTTDVEFADLKRLIKGLQKHGFATSVDDFGIGYSSLNLIKEIPWNVLKIDKSLLPEKGAENVWQNSIMFKYVVAMAQEMGLECIAEGVETREQVQILAENGCDLAQGFFFDKPMPAAEFESRLTDRFYTM